MAFVRPQASHSRWSLRTQESHSSRVDFGRVEMESDVRFVDCEVFASVGLSSENCVLQLRLRHDLYIFLETRRQSLEFPKLSSNNPK